MKKGVAQDEQVQGQEGSPVHGPIGAGTEAGGSAALDNLDLLDRELDAENGAIADQVAQQEQQSERAKAQAEAEEQAARMGAAMAVGFLETMLRSRVPYVVIDDATRAQVIDKAAPVMRKYGGGMPEWLLPYREEVELGMVLASAAFGIYGQVQAHKAEAIKLERERQARQAERDQQEAAA